MWSVETNKDVWWCSRSGGGSGASSAARGGASRDSGSSTQERPSEFSRWRERQYFGPRRWLESALRDTSWEKEGGKQYTGWWSLDLRVEPVGHNNIHFLFAVR